MDSSRRLLRLGSIAAALVLGACGEDVPLREWTPGDHGHPRAEPEPASGRAPAVEAETGGEERAVRALWLAACASCHGREGRGDGAERPPGAQLPDLGDPAFQASRKDEQLASVIRDGRGMMPGFGKQVVEAGIVALVRHVRTLGAPSAAPAAPQAPSGAGTDAPVVAPR